MIQAEICMAKPPDAMLPTTMNLLSPENTNGTDVNQTPILM